MTLPYKKIVVFGAHGQVGSALLARLGTRAVPMSEKDADFLKPESLTSALTRIQPDAIINAAAYTAVDKAESEPELAYKINAQAPGAIARYAAENRVTLVHYSTDYVFDGSGVKPRTEDEPAGPLNVYGKTKLEGEQAVLATAAHAYIFRLSWVYDERGKNFLNTMLRLGAEREELKIVADQIGAPTYAGDIAEYTLKALENTGALSGVYHLVNRGETSWYDFAKAIFDEAKRYHHPLTLKAVHPILTKDYPTPALRPKNSRLNTDKFCATFSVTLPHWKDALARCMKHKFTL